MQMTIFEVQSLEVYQLKNGNVSVSKIAFSFPGKHLCKWIGYPTWGPTKATAQQAAPSSSTAST